MKRRANMPTPVCVGTPEGPVNLYPPHTGTRGPALEDKTAEIQFFDLPELPFRPGPHTISMINAGLDGQQSRG